MKRLLIIFCLAPALAIGSIEVQKAGTDKTGKYQSDGIFAGGFVQKALKIISIRHSRQKRTWDERLVFDYGSDENNTLRPGFFQVSHSDRSKTISIDLQETRLTDQARAQLLRHLKGSRLIKSVVFVNSKDDDDTALVLQARSTLEVEVFELPPSIGTPARLVIDLRESHQ
ncbi:MAG: hypothetical protein IT289_09110 [Oligoflexia bacterium]|nr:hypothetical protein [Oligoflexia bacterium]